MDLPDHYRQNHEAAAKERAWMNEVLAKARDYRQAALDFRAVLKNRSLPDSAVADAAQRLRGHANELRRAAEGEP